MLNESVLKIITGEETVDWYDTVIESWSAEGGTEMTEDANEWWAGAH